MGRLGDKFIEKRAFCRGIASIIKIKLESYTSESCDVAFRGNIHGDPV